MPNVIKNAVYQDRRTKHKRRLPAVYDVVVDSDDLVFCTVNENDFNTYGFNKYDLVYVTGIVASIHKGTENYSNGFPGIVQNSIKSATEILPVKVAGKYRVNLSNFERLRDGLSLNVNFGAGTELCLDKKYLKSVVPKTNENAGEYVLFKSFEYAGAREGIEYGSEDTYNFDQIIKVEFQTPFVNSELENENILAITTGSPTVGIYPVEFYANGLGQTSTGTGTASVLKLHIDEVLPSGTPVVLNRTAIETFGGT